MTELWSKLITPRNISLTILFIIALTSFTIVLRQIFKFRRTYRIKLIAFYIFLILFQISVTFYDMFKVDKFTDKHNITNISAYIFIIFEYIILAHLIASNLKSKSIKKFLFISSFIFVVTAIFNWYFIKNFSKTISLTNTIEAIPLILACLYFFYEILKTLPILRLDKESSFWTVTGILFLFICISPFYLAFEYLRKMPEMQITDYVGYAIVIILFTKASFCKETKIV